jgi:hypothetical protein
VALLLFITISFIGFEKLPQVVRSLVFPIVIGLLIAKIVATLFFLLDDVRRIFQWGGGKAISAINGSASNAEGITRSVFLSWLGIGVGGGLFGTLLYGFGNKYKYRVEKVKLTFENLPSAFKGLKIIQISDIHSGSIEDKLAVEKGVRKLMEQEPDLVFFTGDLVNNVATEMDGFIDVFSNIKATLGVYSILGNHDYGDYVKWPSKDSKEANLNRLKEVHGEMGWRLLLNEHVTVLEYIMMI